MDDYSENLLQNGDANNGTNNWVAQNTASILGGLVGPNCFKVSPNGNISQEIFINSQPETILVESNFLPEEYINDINVRQKIQIELTYGDGTKDINLIPCKGGEIYGF